MRPGLHDVARPGAGGDLGAVITALDDDELATVWSDDTTLGWVSEALALTDSEATSRGSINCADRALGELRERVVVELAAGHRVRLV